jgi:hypothetical protein
MRGFILGAVFSLLLGLCLSSSAFASGTREIRVNRRPPGLPSTIVRWAYVRGGTLITSDRADFDRRVKDYDVYVYDPKAPASDARSVSERAERTERTGGSTPPRAKTPGEAAARGVACTAAAASLSSCKGEKGGNPYGIPGGLNPRASSSPAKQAMASGVIIVLTVVDVKQIATAAARVVSRKLSERAAKQAVEKAALEAAEQAWKQGGRRGSREAVEKAAQEAAEKAAQEAAEQASRRARVGSAARGEAGKATGEAAKALAIDPTRPANEVLPGSLRREFPGQHLNKSLNQIKDLLRTASGAEKRSLQTAKKILEQSERLLEKTRNK